VPRIGQRWCAVGPSDEDRAVELGGVDNPSDVVHGSLHGIVRRGAGFSAGPGVEENRAVSPAETVNDAIPVMDGAKAAAKEEQRRCATGVVDGVELRVGSRDGEVAGHIWSFRTGLMGDQPPLEGWLRRACHSESSPGSLLARKSKKGRSSIIKRRTVSRL